MILVKNMRIYFPNTLQDDPLSALDVHVGAHIYKHAIEDFLLKQGKTVVLVTHQLQYVPHADQVGIKIARFTHLSN